MQSIGAHGACRERGSQAANGTACGVGTATLQAAVRTTRTACAPWMDQRICWDLFMRRLIGAFASSSVVEVPIGRPICCRRRSEPRRDSRGRFRLTAYAARAAFAKLA